MDDRERKAAAKERERKKKEVSRRHASKQKAPCDLSLAFTRPLYCIQTVIAILNQVIHRFCLTAFRFTTARVWSDFFSMSFFEEFRKGLLVNQIEAHKIEISYRYQLVTYV